VIASSAIRSQLRRVFFVPPETGGKGIKRIVHLIIHILMARAASEGSSPVSQILFDSSGICEDGEAVMVANA
jgi:hypothetical protein